MIAFLIKYLVVKVSNRLLCLQNCLHQIFAKNSSDEFARLRHHSTCCLYSVLDEFICVFVVF